MSWRMRIGLSTSVSLHILLIAFLWFEPPIEKVESPPTLVTFFEPKEGASSTQKPKSSEDQKKKKTSQKSSREKRNKGKPKTAKSGNKGKGFSYGDFSPSTRGAGTFAAHQARQEGGWAGNEVMETMNGIGLSEYSGNHYFFEVLVDHLNKMIPYPKELWEHKITGKVWVKVLINRKGQLIRVIDASRTAPVIGAYVMVNIYQALKRPLPERYWYSEDKDLALMLTFDYDVSSVPSMPEVQSARYFKNRFEFKRVAKIPNLIAEISQDYARYIPPVVPIPGGAYVDFVRLYHFIEAWRGDDPLTIKRNKRILTREKMQQILENSQNAFEERRKQTP